MKKSLSVQLLLIILLMGCKNEPIEVNDNPPNIRTMMALEKSVIVASNDFSIEIFKKVNSEKPSENIFISPFSISTALSMTLNGASGETANGIKQALNQSELTTEQINVAYEGLMEYLPKIDKKVNLKVANSNWYRDDLTIKPEFKEALLHYYLAEIFPANFQNPATLDLINQWISDQTNGLIKNMLDQIPPDAVMYLINAIYFKADWKYSFEANKTTKTQFGTGSGTTTVDMMYTKGANLLFNSSSEFLFADIPYGNGQFSMSVLMAKDGKDINELIDELSARDFESIVSGARAISASLYFPKFKMSYKQPLNEVLSDMGMEDAFDPSRANFSELFTDDLNLNISRILHQSYIEVNEKGTEAAAVTSVEISVTSIDPNQPKVIRIDRPFVYFIREKNSNTILFSGKMINPAL